MRHFHSSRGENMWSKDDVLKYIDIMIVEAEFFAIGINTVEFIVRWGNHIDSACIDPVWGRRAMVEKLQLFKEKFNERIPWDTIHGLEIRNFTTSTSLLYTPCTATCDLLEELAE